MSAGNVVLTSTTFSPTVFPSSQTLLPIGNYWIEEIDFVFSFAITTAAASNNFQFFMQMAGNTFWLLDFALVSAAAGTVVYNIPVISRPRIFLLRGANVTITISTLSNVSNVISSVNLYGRSLP